MDKILHYLNENPLALLLLIAFVGAWNAVLFYFGGKRAEAIFSGVDLSRVTFRERGASGYSKKSLFTKLGGARRCLDVIVTSTELCIKGIYSPFTYIGTKYDLTRRVGLKQIVGVTSLGSTVELKFTSGSDVVLELKDTEAFIRAVMTR